MIDNDLRVAVNDIIHRLDHEVSITATSATRELLTDARNMIDYLCALASGEITRHG